MSSPAALLARCRPLTDCVRLALQFFLWQAILLPGFLFLVALFLLLLSGGKISPAFFQTDAAAWVVISLLTGGLLYVAFRMLLRETRDTPGLCLLLRAFRADATSDKMRAWLKAALGPRYKLSGIRPPKERVPWMARLLSPLATGMHYAGSRQFELEAADHNWMARLLASFAQSRFVFIDVREMTPHVMDEVSLAWQVFGAEKCVFIVNERGPSALAALTGSGGSSDSDQPNPDIQTRWRERLTKMLTDSGHTLPPSAVLKLLSWPSDDNADSTAFCAAVKQHVHSMPKGTPVIDESHISFVQQRVPAAQWKTRFYEGGVFLTTASIIFMSVISVAWRKIAARGDWLPAAAFYAVIHLLFWCAWFRARRQRRHAAVINPAGPPSSARLWGAVYWMFLYYLIWVFVFLVQYSEWRAHPTALHQL